MSQSVNAALNESSASPKTLVLCFDGTGNKFLGTEADSNILKIYSLLDREDPTQCHYYQPGIGTYVETSSLSRKSRLGRIRSWYIKAKDQAVGTSFGEHVMSGYKFLMRYYTAGDNIYFFGRGAYTARFLAQMLDYIGLLSTGNEEMLRFAWKTFARWQMRSGDDPEEKRMKRETFEFMCNFRETFSRPIEAIRFIGLFDCVNSVPQFESAWMRRTKFPYTARTTAKVIRHAVSIDERRAKFRQDLISEQRNADPFNHHEHHHNHHLHWHHEKPDQAQNNNHPADRKPLKRTSTLLGQSLFRPGRARRPSRISTSAAASVASVDSIGAAPCHNEKTSMEDDGEQDILEVWFAGQHGDIGGGWTRSGPGNRCASDLPLIWMLREARRAGLPVDERKLAQFEQRNNALSGTAEQAHIPVLQLEGNVVPSTYDTLSEEEAHVLATQTSLHDSLRFGCGLPWYAVLSWQIMEHMPFRRMDLQPDGTWKPISWPLPRGEVRDMPEDAVVHNSVIKRMRDDPDYRPGNLIVGGGGRGVRVAPPDAATPTWHVVRDEGCHLGELVRKVKLDKE